MCLLYKCSPPLISVHTGLASYTHTRFVTYKSPPHTHPPFHWHNWETCPYASHTGCDTQASSWGLRTCQHTQSHSRTCSSSHTGAKRGFFLSVSEDQCWGEGSGVCGGVGVGMLLALAQRAGWGDRRASQLVGARLARTQINWLVWQSRLESWCGEVVCVHVCTGIRDGECLLCVWERD